jgi:hypothetical protein
VGGPSQRVLEKKTSYYIISLDRTPGDIRAHTTVAKLRANWVSNRVCVNE